jgi:hypothetical protein
MNAPIISAPGVWQLIRTFGWRIVVVVALAVAVSGATYAVALSPVGTSMATGARRPPGRPTDAGAQVTTAPSTDGATTTGAVPANGASATQAQVSQSAPAQAAAPQRPQGGDGGPGRGPSLARGLPQLGMHAGVIAIIVLVFNCARMLWQTLRRRRGGTRATVFNRATMRR